MHKRARGYVLVTRIGACATLFGGTITQVKRETEYVEGPEAWARFESAMRAVIAVPHAEIQRRIAEKRKAGKRSNSIVSEMDAEYGPLPGSPARKTPAKK